MAIEINFVPSSDVIERQEHAALRNATYWSSDSEDDFWLQEAYASMPIASTSKLPEPVLSPTTTHHRKRTSSSPLARSRHSRSSSLPDAADEWLRSPPSPIPIDQLSDVRPAAPAHREVSPSPLREEPLPEGRSLRVRTAVQQNPFTAEHARYAGILNRNGWEDAVLRLPKLREETEEERKERKRRQVIRGQDDLQGWLILEDGTRIRHEDDSFQNDPDGDSMLEDREDLRVPRRPKTARMQNIPRIRHYSDDHDRLYDQRIGGRSHSDNEHSIRKEKNRHRRSKGTVQATDSRGTSEPPSSSPRAGPVRRAAPVFNSSSEDDRSRHDTSARVVQGRSLKGKRKRALGAMMPAAFLKRAARDLELMRKEKLTYDDGSGDGSGSASEAFDSDGDLRPGRAAIRRGKRRAIDLTGDAFTDESTDREGSGEEDEDPPVADAVTNWLGAFGPKRKMASKTQVKRRDFLDRLLVQSKKDSRRLAPPTTAKSRHPIPRLPFTERSNVDASFRDPAAPRPGRKRRKIRFDEKSLFEAAVPGIAPVQLDGPGPGERSGETWDQFGRFSHDFGLQRLPTGLSFSPESYIGQGRLRALHQSLCDPDAQTPLQSPLSVFGIVLDAGMSDGDFLAQAPELCDRVFAEVERSSGENDGSSFVPEVCEVLHWLFCKMACTENASLRSEVDVQIVHLQQRLMSIKMKEHDAIRIQWTFLEGALRNRAAAADVSRMLSDLVMRLMSQSMSMAKMVALLRGHAAGKMLDASLDCIVHAIEIWVCLLRLGIEDVVRDHVFGVSTLWHAVENASAAHATLNQLVPIQASEALAFAASALAMMSQFSLDGISTAKPTFPAQWSVILTPLQNVNPVAFAEDTRHLSNVALQRRDGYVATLFARCLTFVDRWRWVIDGTESLLPRLFDIINSRLLARLATDGLRDFPGFLQEFDGQIGTDLDRRGDTAFHVFLKLFVHSSRHLAGESDAERRKAFSKLVTRIVPQRKMPFTRDAVSSRVSLDRSILVNHYSLFMVLIFLSPASAPSRLGQIRNLLSFEEADDEARLVCLRAIMYLGILLRHLHLSVGPVLAWLAQICRYLRRQYEVLETQRQPLAKNGTARHPDAVAKDMYSVALSLSTLLRAVQHLLLTDQKIAKAANQRAPYPDLALLDDAWAKELLHSPLAQDPLIGAELLKVLECFLTLRDDAVLRTESGISQDEFGGVGTLDYEDPALCAMLGVEPSGEAARAQERERMFAELIHSDLSSALFRLITAAYARDTSKNRAAPVVNARSNVVHMTELVNCWSRCATITVKAGFREWQQYIVWGDEVWKRISDPLGRREVALSFLVRAMQADRRAFELNQEEYLSVWCQTIVAKRLSLQHHLTSALLDVAAEPSLLCGHAPTNIPFARNEDTGRYDISLEDLAERRLTLLTAVFERAHRLLLNGGTSSSFVTAHIAGMCTAARDNLESFDALEIAAKTSYAAFARQMEEKLRSRLGSAVTDAMAALKLLMTSLDKAEAANV